MNVNGLIEAAVRKHGSVKKLAAHLGVSEPTIYNWRGGTTPKRDALAALAEAAGETLPAPVDTANDKPVRERRPRSVAKPKPRKLAPKAAPLPAPGRIRFRDLAAALETRADVCGNAAKALRDLEAKCPELFA